MKSSLLRAEAPTAVAQSRISDLILAIFGVLRTRRSAGSLDSFNVNQTI
jgi:hypothetical protein